MLYLTCAYSGAIQVVTSLLRYLANALVVGQKYQKHDDAQKFFSLPTKNAHRDTSNAKGPLTVFIKVAC